MAAGAVTTEVLCPNVTFATDFLLHNSQSWNSSKTPALFGRLLSSFTELFRYYPDLLPPNNVERLLSCLELSSHWTTVDRKKVHDGVLFLRNQTGPSVKRPRLSDVVITAVSPPDPMSTHSIETRDGARRELPTDSAWTKLSAFANAVAQPTVWTTPAQAPPLTGRALETVKSELSTIDVNFTTKCALVRRTRDHRYHREPDELDNGNHIPFTASTMAGYVCFKVGAAILRGVGNHLKMQRYG
jgi:hypothetical protein